VLGQASVVSLTMSQIPQNHGQSAFCVLPHQLILQGCIPVPHHPSSDAVMLCDAASPESHVLTHVALHGGSTNRPDPSSNIKTSSASQRSSHLSQPLCQNWWEIGFTIVDDEFVDDEICPLSSDRDVRIVVI
jgi:hypothetical protein